MSSRRIARNAGALFALQFANYAIPLVTFPYIVRTVGIDNYGSFVFAIGVVQIGVVATSFGFNHAATGLIANQKSNPSVVSQIFSSVLTIKLVLAAAYAGLIGALVIVVPVLHDHALLIACSVPMLLGEALFPTWLFLGLEKMGRVTLFVIAGRAAAIAVLLLTVHNANDTHWAALAQSLPYTFSAIFALHFAHRRLGIRFRLHRCWAEYRRVLREGAGVFFGTLPSQIYVRGNIVVLGALASRLEVGRYGIAQRISGLLVSLIQPIAQALYPHICRIAANDPARARDLRYKTGLAAVIGSVTVVVALEVVSDPILELVSGSPSIEVKPVLRWFYPSIVLATVNVLLGNFLLAARQYRALARANTASAVVFAAAAAPLAIYYGAAGMALCMTLVEFATLIGTLTAFRLAGMTTISPAAPEA